MTSEFTVRSEFTCMACGLPESELPPGHEAQVTDDEFGWPTMICTSAVMRNTYTVTTYVWERPAPD